MMGAGLRRCAGLVVVSSALLLVPAARADAALCVRLSTTPVRPVVGETVQVELRTLRTASGTNDEFRLEPRAVPSTYPFHVAAESGNQIVLIHVQRSGDPNLWTGQFVLGETGLWHLVVENFVRKGSGIDPRCYSQLPLVVAPAGEQPQPSASPSSSLGLTLMLAVGVLAVILGATLFVLIRSRVTRPPP
jgi:hypothetical protein